MFVCLFPRLSGRQNSSSTRKLCMSWRQCKSWGWGCSFDNHLLPSGRTVRCAGRPVNPSHKRATLCKSHISAVDHLPCKGKVVGSVPGISSSRNERTQVSCIYGLHRIQCLCSRSLIRQLLISLSPSLPAQHQGPRRQQPAAAPVGSQGPDPLA